MNVSGSVSANTKVRGEESIILSNDLKYEWNVSKLDLNILLERVAGLSKAVAAANDSCKIDNC